MTSFLAFYTLRLTVHDFMISDANCVEKKNVSKFGWSIGKIERFFEPFFLELTFGFNSQNKELIKLLVLPSSNMSNLTLKIAVARITIHSRFLGKEWLLLKY